MFSKTRNRLLSSAMIFGLLPLALVADTETGKSPISLDGQAQAATTQLAEKIRKEIVTLPNYGVFDDLSFRIQGSEVILNGYASRPTLKTDAERMVKHIEGVDKVINNIEVLPLSQMDDQVRFRTFMAIYNTPALRRYSSGRPFFMPRLTPLWAAGGVTNNPPVGWFPIHIVVKNGHVTLKGVVAQEMDKTIAGMRANQVFGVFSVTNDLIVEGKAQKQA